MSSRSLNKVQLIGNLTRDPELRYTPQGTAVCTFGLATNRAWASETGEKREEAEFHRIVAWSKLAELCSQLLFKGRKVYVEGRLQTRNWTAQDGSQRQTTEIVIEEMIILDSRQVEAAAQASSLTAGGAVVQPQVEAAGEPLSVGETPAVTSSEETPAATPATTSKKKKTEKGEEEKPAEEQKPAEEAAEDNTDLAKDIPF